MIVHSLGVSEDLTLDELSDHIKDSDLVIVESFLVRPKEARKGAFDYDPMETPQVIGALKLLCHLLEAIRRAKSKRETCWVWIC